VPYQIATKQLSFNKGFGAVKQVVATSILHQDVQQLYITFVSSSGVQTSEKTILEIILQSSKNFQ
jgi:hypothetical protein